jgi:formylglycine-generating enzyme required for sulfatase activity
VDLLAQGLCDETSDHREEVEKARILAEKFNDDLGDMDRFYNRHVLVPGGEYKVGSRGVGRGERLEKTIHLQPFCIGKFPVTNALFEIFVEKTGYCTTAERLGYGTVYGGRCKKVLDERSGLERFIWRAALVVDEVQGACWYQPSGPGSALHKKRNHPVVQVSLEDAMAFAAWTGKRLPTEDEWEAASRTSAGHLFPWGDEWRDNVCNTEASYVSDTTPVDKYLDFAGELGVADCVGNVLEWTMDLSANPAPSGTETALYVVKGGSWCSENPVPLSFRFHLNPAARSNILGFRCVAY